MLFSFFSLAISSTPFQIFFFFGWLCFISFSGSSSSSSSKKYGAIDSLKKWLFFPLGVIVTNFGLCSFLSVRWGEASASVGAFDLHEFRLVAAHADEAAAHADFNRIAQRCNADDFKGGARRGAEHHEAASVFGMLLAEAHDAAFAADGKVFEKHGEKTSFVVF